MQKSLPQASWVILEAQPGCDESVDDVLLSAHLFFYMSIRELDTPFLKLKARTLPTARVR